MRPVKGRAGSLLIVAVASHTKLVTPCEPIAIAVDIAGTQESAGDKGERGGAALTVLTR